MFSDLQQVCELNEIEYYLSNDNVNLYKNVFNIYNYKYS